MIVLARTYWWAGWAVVALVLGCMIFRPPKTLILTEYKDRIVYRTVAGGTISGHVTGGTTVVTPGAVTNEGGEVDWSASYYNDSEFIEDKAVVQKETIPVISRPAVFIGPSAFYADGWYAELGLGIRMYRALYLQGGMGTKSFLKVDTYRAGMFVTF